MPVDPERDHIRGPADAPVTLVEYGDFECPYCGRAEPVDPRAARRLRRRCATSGATCRCTTCIRTPQLAAEAAEAAAAQGAFWQMHDLLLAHQGALGPRDLLAYAEQLGLDVDALPRGPASGTRTPPRVEPRTSTAPTCSGVSGTPTFFINGRRHHGAYDIETLSAAVRAARARAALADGA